MTVEPGAPNAAAIYLYREERDDDRLHMQTLYVRLKVLTEKGKEYADVEIPYEGRDFSIRAVEGRTIHSDGTIIPFTGKPYEKMLEKSKTQKVKAKVFSLPDVEVGSILEYRYILAYEDNLVVAAQWYIQQPLYVRKAHYQFLPSGLLITDDHGNVSENSLAYSQWLPRGVEVKESLATSAMGSMKGRGAYNLDVERIDPVPEEEYMPPMKSVSYRVLFYYTSVTKAEEYWRSEGKYWSKEAERFMSPGKLGGAVGQIVSPSDTPARKAQKLYSAVMKLENTSFTRDHSETEDKAAGIKIKTAEDIWSVKRGSAEELTLLFIGLARAAGLQAYAIQVTDRNEGFFVPAFLSTRQLDDYLAIVVLDGKEQYLDPGERYCPFGVLHWKHTLAGGLRQTDHGTQLAETPSLGYKDTKVLRVADLYLEADGKTHGTLRITMTGNRALYWRQRALSTDEVEIKKEFEDALQSEVPSSVEVKTNHFLGLADYDGPLMAVVDATGAMGTATAKRVFLPATFFEAGTKPLFVHDKRTVPVDLDYPYQVQDQVTIYLPKSWVVESAPKNAQIPLPNSAVYQVEFKPAPEALVTGRQFVLANTLFKVDEYASLKEFFEKVNAKDQEQAVLTPAAAGSSGGAQ